LEKLYFEDLPLGGEWSTRGRTITEADLSAFIACAGDYNPLYADAHAAAGGPYGGLVLPPSLISAVAFGLGAMDVPLPATLGMVGMNWRFLQPARPGDTLRSRWRLVRKRPVEKPGRGLVFWQVEVINQHDQAVASGEVGRLIECRPAQAAETEKLAVPQRTSSGRRRRRRPPRESKPESAGQAEVVPVPPEPEPMPSEATPAD
jgi:acyl dehydratase